MSKIDSSTDKAMLSRHLLGYPKLAKNIFTYRKLKEALEELTDDQLDMTVTVTKGCDEMDDGSWPPSGREYMDVPWNDPRAQAKFFDGDELTLAINEGSRLDMFINKGYGANGERCSYHSFEENQPILLFDGFPYYDPNRPSRSWKCADDARRKAIDGTRITGKGNSMNREQLDADLSRFPEYVRIKIMLTAEDYKLLADCEDAKDVLEALDAIEQKDKDNGSTK